MTEKRLTDYSDNPLISLMLDGRAWVPNGELASALGLVNTTRSKSVVGHWKSVIEDLGEETRLGRPDESGWRRGREMRLFSKKAVALVAMRARTATADGFRQWAAELVSTST